MQPRRVQTPPRRESFSTMSTESPSWAARTAATYPPGPEPMMQRSYVLLELMPLLVPPSPPPPLSPSETQRGGGGEGARGRMAARNLSSSVDALSGLRRLDRESLVDPVEVVEEADDGGDLENLSLIEICRKLAEGFFRNLVRMAGHFEPEPQRRLVFLLEGAVLEIEERCDLVLRRSRPFRGKSVGVHSIAAGVDERGLERQHLLQPEGDGPGAHDRREVRVHRGEKPRPVSEDAVHVGDASPLRDLPLEGISGRARDLRAPEAR